MVKREGQLYVVYTSAKVSVTKGGVTLDTVTAAGCVSRASLRL
jgi:hypothetical protein